MKLHANGRNIVGQQPSTLLDVTCRVRLHTLWHVVACFWELLHPFAHHYQHGRNNSHHCWHNNVGSCCVRLHVFKCYMQTDITLFAYNSQHCWMLHVASVCTPCCMSLPVVGSCCAKFETGHTFIYVQTDATTPNKVASVCTGLDYKPVPEF